VLDQREEEKHLEACHGYEQQESGRGGRHDDEEGSRGQVQDRNQVDHLMEQKAV
jgi:hypothetical protein